MISAPGGGLSNDIEFMSLAMVKTLVNPAGQARRPPNLKGEG
jgi:hypothetical protein